MVQKAVIAVAIILIATMSAIVLWDYVIKDPVKKTIEEHTDIKLEYQIDLYFEDAALTHLNMSDLKELDTITFRNEVDASSDDLGPYLYQVIALRINTSKLTENSTVTISSTVRGGSKTLSWPTVANETNRWILDFTNRGTTKLTNPETSRTERIKDVDRIEVWI